MISSIKGRITRKKENAVEVHCGHITYEVAVPLAVMNSMEGRSVFGSETELVIYHYYQIDQSRGTPVLIGFENEIEREFFEKFISVSGVGPKAACRALAQPFSLIAGAIDSGNVSFLKGLPGIGEQKARLIVAKLQGKVGKFGLIRDEEMDISSDHEDIKEEAVAVLIQLQYRKTEAEDMVRKALERQPGITTSEELLNEVYRERKK
ncbi:MAG: OB-fold domain-containing protein [Candidatus Omnitrophica bacterium]|nr:OB-fold domain-containing protein [Candidatus Omnitrophota bacterium]MDD5488912.1 OB-fold domain-containing protein [Candidatus Omnitrophota bacterium]